MVLAVFSLLNAYRLPRAAAGFNRRPAAFP